MLGTWRYVLSLVGIQFVSDLLLLASTSPADKNLTLGCAAMTGYFVLFPISVLFFYQLYDSFPEEADTRSPEEAAFPVLIPVFNIYWVYRMLQEFREEVVRLSHEYAMDDEGGEEKGNDSRLADTGEALSTTLWARIFWAGGIIVFLRVPVGNWIVHPLMVWMAVDAANAVRQHFGSRGE